MLILFRCVVIFYTTNIAISVVKVNFFRINRIVIVDNKSFFASIEANEDDSML